MVSTGGAAFSERAILLFEIAGRRYGLLASDVRELVRAVAIAPLPKAPAVVEGVINVRGEVVPVFDMRARFGIPGRPVAPSDHLILARAGTRSVAIRVDRATELALVEERLIQDARAIVPEGEYVAGVVTLSDGLALIHDLKTFLDDREARALAEALESDAGANA